MSFPTRCCVWGKWDTILLNPRRNKYSGIQNPINFFSELNRIDGKPTERKIFPGFTTAGILDEIQRMMYELQCDPADFKGRIIFMSVFNDIVWDAKGNEELCEKNQKELKRGHWSFLGPGSKKKWYATYNSKTKRMLGSD